MVIVKADCHIINQIFQYDIMKLLHSTITFVDHLDHVFIKGNYDPNDITKEAVVCLNTVGKITDSLSSVDCYTERL